MSARNIPGLKTLFVNTMNVYDIIRHDKFIITKDAVARLRRLRIMRPAEDIIKRPYITEKSNAEIANGKYTLLWTQRLQKLK